MNVNQEKVMKILGEMILKHLHHQNRIRKIEHLVLPLNRV